ncbi:hypothetical protein GCM10027174_45660 [Salinifilum aidingensis]
MSVLAESPAGNLPTARLEVPTWSYYDEPPSAVDAALDRKADRLFTATRALYWATGAVFPSS